MTYSVPAHGEPNWDGKINPSLQYLKDTAEAAETPTGAQAKATAAQNAAISAAATDATNKANTAQANAISTAASDATTKANSVQSSLNTHVGNVANPHSVTKAQVGLGNVDNTSDASKPVSTAQQTALDAKVSKGSVSVSVKDYGARGDGVTDDTTAIQNGINAGVHLYFPPGVYLVSNLTPKPGMHLSGAAKGDPGTTGTPLASLHAYAGAVFSSGSYYCKIENLELVAITGSAAEVMNGSWSQSVIHNCRLRQFETNKSVINVTGWIDMTIEGQSEVMTNLACTAPAFKAVSGSGGIAHVSFRDTVFTGGQEYAIWLEATGGGASVVTGVTLDNVVFETARNGCVKLLSCRSVNIVGSSDWDRDVASTQDRIYIGASPTAGAASGQITIDGWTRDNSTALGGSAYDIKSESTTFDLNIVGCGHQTGATFSVNAGSATGRVVGGRVTLTNGLNMDTDDWQVYTPTVSPATQGNGTLTGRYQRRGKTVNFEIVFTIGTTTTIAGMNFTLPVAALIDTPVTGTALHQGVGYYGIEGIAIGTTTTLLTGYFGAGAFLTAFNSTSPFTWASTDQVIIRGSYRAA